MKLLTEVETTRIRGKDTGLFRHPVIREEPLALIVNDEPYVTMMRLPGNEKELVTGFLFTEGIIGSIDDVFYLKHCGSGTDEEQNRVDVKLAPHCKLDSNRRIESRSACGLCSRTFINDLTEGLPSLEENKLSVSVPVLKRIEKELASHQPLFQQTGAVHGAALYDNSGSLSVIKEDIGRHNALDEVIGHALIRGWNLSGKILISTGRASFEMAYKTIRAGIPVMASVSAPTSMALEVSRRLGLTLVGFFRKEGFNIYANSHRITK
ncbi:MAG: formate dehydrogenase accessory sulfurtransferase FdhD [bacterium]